MPDFTTAEKLTCVQREINQRKRVYPRLVAKGSMTQPKADMEIACMEAVAEDYRREVAKGDLFARSPETGKIA